MKSFKRLILFNFFITNEKMLFLHNIHSLMIKALNIQQKSYFSPLRSTCNSKKQNDIQGNISQVILKIMTICSHVNLGNKKMEHHYNELFEVCIWWWITFWRSFFFNLYEFKPCKIIIMISRQPGIIDMHVNAYASYVFGKLNSLSNK